MLRMSRVWIIVIVALLVLATPVLAGWEGRVDLRDGTSLTVEGGRVFRGPNTHGEILFTFYDGRVFEGPNTHGEILFTIIDDRVFEGPNASGAILYTFNGFKVHEGPNVQGPVVGYLKGPTLTHKLLAPIIVQQLYK